MRQKPNFVGPDGGNDTVECGLIGSAVPAIGGNDPDGGDAGCRQVFHGLTRHVGVDIE